MILENLPIFLHRASNNGGFSGIKLIFSKANQYIPITCTDEITITYISGGVKKTDTYSGLSITLVSIPCDANTQVVITGAVEEIDLSMQAYLISAKIKNTALQNLNCSNCPALATLDLSTNTALQALDCSNCPALAEIKYAAGNEDVSTAIAQAITDATADNGTVYTDSAAAYYSTIETAATTKGWTIEQIPA